MDNEKKCYIILKALGANMSIKGYRYIIDALCIMLDDPAIIYAITTELYPAVAEKNHSEPNRVERCIRHCINGMPRNNIWEKIVGNAHATNAEFLSSVVEYLKYCGAKMDGEDGEQK